MSLYKETMQTNRLGQRLVTQKGPRCAVKAKHAEKTRPPSLELSYLYISDMWALCSFLSVNFFFLLAVYIRLGWKRFFHQLCWFFLCSVHFSLMKCSHSNDLIPALISRGQKLKIQSLTNVSISVVFSLVKTNQNRERRFVLLNRGFHYYITTLHILCRVASCIKCI